MPVQLAWRGKTAAALAAFVGQAKEILVNRDRWSLHVQDGATPGGIETARADLQNVTPEAVIDLLPSGCVIGRAETPLTDSFSTNTAALAIGSVVYTPNRANSILRFTLNPGQYLGLSYPSGAEADMSNNAYCQLKVNGAAYGDLAQLAQASVRTAANGDGGNVLIRATSTWFIPVGADLGERTISLEIHSNGAGAYVTVASSANAPTRLVIEELKA